MFDPLLGGLGEYASREMGKLAALWLSRNKLKIDAVLSSNLARAIQTALLMFPHDVPTYVVPYIREHAAGKSNAPKDQKDQVHALSQAVNGSFQLNYEWVRVFGEKTGTWEDFEFFLRHSFLPNLIRDLKKEPGDDIVIPVVSHSLFMRESLGDHCSWAWQMRDSSKPLNNQVLHLRYVYETESAHPESYDATPRHSLELSDMCGEVASGMKISGSEPLCMSDIGEECSVLIKRYAHSRDTIWQGTVEKDIVDRRKYIERLGKTARRYLDRLTEVEQDLAMAKSRGAVSCVKTWTGCSPAECVRSDFGTDCVLRSNADPVKLEHKMQQLRQALNNTWRDIDTSTDRQEKLKAMSCRGGGHPNEAWYLQASR